MNIPSWGGKYGQKVCHQLADKSPEEQQQQKGIPTPAKRKEENVYWSIIHIGRDGSSAWDTVPILRHYKNARRGMSKHPFLFHLSRSNAAKAMRRAT